MSSIVNEEFVITEEHVHAVDDSPTPGVYSETHLKSEKHGPLSKTVMQKTLQELLAKYQEQGYRQSHGYSTENRLVLKMGNLEITLVTQKYGSDYK